MRLGLDVGLQEATQFLAGGGGQDADPGGAGVEAMLALQGVDVMGWLASLVIPFVGRIVTYPAAVVLYPFI